MVADVWAAYGKRTLPGSIYFFSDMDKLTMFADYRIPQLLRHLRIIEYNDRLCNQIDNCIEISFGSEEEAEIRACTVIAVERLKVAMNNLIRIIDPTLPLLLSIELDWLLWNQGEKSKDVIAPHHRTKTIYY